MVIAADNDEGRLRLINPEGMLVHSLGRKGEGPGEFRVIFDVQWYAKENLIRVVDFGNRRISSWNLDGRFLGEIPFPGQMIFDFHFIDSKRVLTIRDKAGHFEGRPRLCKIEIDGQVNQDLWVKDLGKKRQATEIPGRVRRLVSWDPRIVFAAGHDFVVVNWSESDRLYLLDLQGKPLGRPITLKMKRPPVSDDDVAREIQNFNPDWRSELAQKLVRAEVWPTVYSMTVDHEDRVWVFAYRRSDEEPYPFFVFDRQGRVLASGEIPNLPEVTKQGLYYLLEEDEEMVLRRVGGASDLFGE